MKIRTVIAIVLFVGGLAVVLYGIGFALKEFVGMYSSAIESPLDSPEGGEKGVSERMIRYVIIGAIGIPPLMVGSAMMGMGFVARVIKMVQGMQKK